MMDAAMRRWLAHGRRRALAGSLAGAALLAVSMFLPATSPAAGRTQTVDYTLHVPAMVIDNLCNGEPVNLSGDLHIRESTTQRADGSYTVTSTTNGKNLRGPGLITMLNYLGQDTEQSNQYVAPPPYPTTFTDTHYTKLVPQGNAPSMYLVIVLREVVLADGTVVPTINRMFLTCTQPKCGAQPGKH
jgi:hypothetical protein